MNATSKRRDPAADGALRAHVEKKQKAQNREHTRLNAWCIGRRVRFSNIAPLDNRGQRARKYQ